MNLYVFCIHISIMLLLPYALSKSLPEISNKDSEPEAEISDSIDDTESVHETNHYGLKRFKSDKQRGHGRRRRTIEEQINKKRCAVMYKNDEPVGILQAYDDIYRFLPIHSDEKIEVEISPFSDSKTSSKRETSENTDEDEESLESDELPKNSDFNSQFSDDRYPYIFAKFKVDSRIEKPEGKTRTLHKRESNTSVVNDTSSKSLKSTLSRIQLNDERAEIELRHILNDMGLIEEESHLDKREAELNEDEDLEHGTNKINLIELDSLDRPKRDKESATKHYEKLQYPEPKTMEKDEDINTNLEEHPDESKIQEKKEVEKRSDDMSAKIKQEIQTKLQKIKEEVRDEINKIKNGNSENFEEDTEEDEEPNEEQLQRKKRNIVISSLTEEETSDIDPVISAENSLVPHIRRRRGVIEEELSENKNDMSQEQKLSEREMQLRDLASLGDGQTIDEASATNLVIDLNPEIETNDEQNVADIRSASKAVEENFDEHTTSSSQYIATTGNHYYIRSLKEYDDQETSDNENEDLEEDNTENDNLESKEAQNLNREKKGCKCVKGDKACKCLNQPSKALNKDGSNFVYVDDVLHVVDLPSASENDGYDEKDQIVKMKERPLPMSKKRSPTEKKSLENRMNFDNSIKNGAYTLDIDPDIYRITDGSKSLSTRRKRNSFADLVAIHGGGPVINHLVAIRERSMLPRKRVRRATKNKDLTEQQLTLTDMSDEDLFGALPQGYEGELARYKRI